MRRRRGKKDEGEHAEASSRAKGDPALQPHSMDNVRAAPCLIPLQSHLPSSWEWQRL